ncbi:MAG: GNAT family N-acetyltransferase [Thermoleophilia bacterium]
MVSWIEFGSAAAAEAALAERRAFEALEGFLARRWRTGWAEERTHCFVARRAGDVVCSIFALELPLYWPDGTGALEVRPVAALDALVTPPRHRRRGFAGALLEWVQQWAEDRGMAATALFSEIGPAYYERRGFRVVPLPFHRGPLPPPPSPEGVAFSGLLKNDASPPGRDGRARDKDERRARSGATGATEDAVSRRPVRSGGQGFDLQQPLRRGGPGGPAYRGRERDVARPFTTDDLHAVVRVYEAAARKCPLAVARDLDYWCYHLEHSRFVEDLHSDEPDMHDFVVNQGDVTAYVRSRSDGDIFTVLEAACLPGEEDALGGLVSSELERAAGKGCVRLVLHLHPAFPPLPHLQLRESWYETLVIRPTPRFAEGFDRLLAGAPDGASPYMFRPDYF